MNTEPKFRAGETVRDGDGEIGLIKRVLKPGVNPVTGNLENRYSVFWLAPYVSIQNPEYESDLLRPTNKSKE